MRHTEPPDDGVQLIIFVLCLVFLVWSLLSGHYAVFLPTFLFLPLDPSLPLLFT